MKKLNLFLLILFLVFPFLTYKVIEFLDYKSSLSNLEKYTFKENETIVKKFTYKNKNYSISKYYDNTNSWSNLNIVLKDNRNYYVLKNIIRCDTLTDGSNLYIKDNIIYIHCIGKSGNIDKYLLEDMNIDKETIVFDYEKTPNLSQIHTTIDKVDNNYIYLSSLEKNNKLKEKSRVKCLFKDKKCNYY